jgi:hypothetical protein
MMFWVIVNEFCADSSPSEDDRKREGGYGAPQETVQKTYSNQIQIK